MEPKSITLCPSIKWVAAETVDGYDTLYVNISFG
jgi:hypothetical protein